VRVVSQVPLDLLDYLVQQAVLVRLASLVNKDHVETRDFRVSRVLPDRLVHLDHLVNLDFRVQLVHVDPLDQLDQEDLVDHRDSQGPLDLQDL